MSGLQRYCSLHDGWVDRAHAAIISVTETGSGPGLPAWACLPCLDQRADKPAFVGRRDAAPIPPEDAA